MCTFILLVHCTKQHSFRNITSDTETKLQSHRYTNHFTHMKPNIFKIEELGFSALYFPFHMIVILIIYLFRRLLDKLGKNFLANILLPNRNNCLLTLLH